MLNTEFSPWPSFTAEEANAVSMGLLSNRVNYWTGQECRAFEEEFAALASTKHAIALANGSLALDAALKALGIGPGDEVVVTPRTFIASISCVVNAGATPVFADVERDSGNLSEITIAKALTPRTKAVICVHLAGWPCDVDPIMALAQTHRLKVIEDCAQANGARYKNRSFGSIGHKGAWSYCQDQIMTAGGEGGMVTTNDQALWSSMWSYKDHGKSYEAVHERQHPPGFRWLHESFGTNWRMLEMQAAIGRTQLHRMVQWIAPSSSHAQAVWSACRLYAAVRVPAFRCGRDKCGTACPIQSGCAHAHYKCHVYVQPDQIASGWSRDRIADAINVQGVSCYQYLCTEVHLEKAFDDTGWRPAERLPIARKLGETSLMFLVHPTLTKSEIVRSCHVIDVVLGQASLLQKNSPPPTS